MAGFRAILICEDARVDEVGALGLTRVFSNRLLAPVPEGPIVMERLVVVAIATGLAGCDFVGVRHRIGAVENPPDWPVLAFHQHDPKHDEHNFVFERENVMFGDGGTFAIEIEMQVRETTTMGRFELSVERR